MIDMIQIMTLLMGFYVTLGGTIRDGKGLKKSKRKKRLEFILHVVFFFSLRDWLFVLPCSSFKRGSSVAETQETSKAAKATLSLADSLLHAHPATKAT
jgi:hypothetical protein